MASDLERAYKALRAKSGPYSHYFDYYDGDQPTMYTTKRLEELFRGLDARFTENWCAVVIDSVRDRINLRSILASDAGVNERLQALLERSDLILESDDVHEAALVTGEAFVIAWPEEGEAQAFFNDPRLVEIFYDTENPRRKKFAAKWWLSDDDNKTHMTLYYPERLEYYSSNQKIGDLNSATTLRLNDTQPNPYGEVPVFHFRFGRRIKSDLASVVPVQNGINKLLADMMVAAEFGAFRQRFVISNAENLGKLKNAPNEIWSLPAGDGIGQQTQAGEFGSTDLENYLRAIDNLATAISSITRTPKHYFFSVGSNLSGEALMTMESPMNKKAQDRIDRFAPEWKRVAQFLLKLDGMEVEKATISVIFDKPETVQPFTEAQTLQMQVTSGVPLVTALRWSGRSQAEIEQMQADAAEMQMSSQASLAQALLEAERRQEQSAAANRTTDDGRRTTDEGEAGRAFASPLRRDEGE